MKRLLVIPLLFCLVGCVSLDAARTFATQTEELAGAAKTFYALTLEADRELAGIADPATETWSSIVGPSTSVIQASRKGLAAVEALSAYAVALKEIADFQDEDNIETSSKAFAKSLNALAKTLRAEPDQSAVASAITALANLYIGVRKHAAVRGAADAAHPHVQVILNALEGHAKSMQDRLTVVSSTSPGSFEGVYNGLKTGYDAAPAHDKARRRIEARLTVERYLLFYSISKEKAEVVTTFASAVKSCKDAHATLKASKFDTDALAEFAKDVRALKSAIEKIRPSAR